MMRYVLGLDLGTSSLKAVLLDEDGVVVAATSRAYAIQAPRPGWAEQEPADWWDACRAAIGDLLKGTGIGGDRVAAVAVGGQMHGTVLLDAAGALLRPAIIWPDGRAAAEAAEAEAILAARGLLPRLGGGVSPGFMLASLLWCREHEPEIWRRAVTALLPKDYLRYRLTGVLAGDPSDGSGIPAIDLYTGEWCEEALAALDLPVSLMPPVRNSADPAGSITGAAAEQCGLRAGTPVLCGGSDQAMAAIGAGLLHPGSLLISISTGGQLVTPLAAPLGAPGHGLRTLCHALPTRGAPAQGNRKPRRAPSEQAAAEASDTTAGHRQSAAGPGGGLAAGDVAGNTIEAPRSDDGFLGGYLALSATLGAGLGVRWWRETVFRDDRDGNDARLLAEAARAPAGAGGLLFLPYLAGERAPILDPAASGALIGLRLEHGRPHLARAVLEGIAFSLRHACEPLEEAGVETQRVILSGGLAQSALMRGILSSVLDRPLLPLASVEQSALGAALLAACHAGFFSSLDEACAAAVRYEAPVEPSSADAARYRLLYSHYRSLYPLLKTTMHELRQQQ
jgi:xylulokinase